MDLKNKKYIKADLPDFSSYEIAPLGLHPNRYEETLLLIEQSFQYQQNHHFDIDFAPLLHRENLKNSYILLHGANKEIVGHIGMMKRDLKNNGWKRPAPLVLIGGVCIKGEYQGRGLLHFFLTRLIHLHAKQASLFLLWGQHADLYKRFHFHLGIGQLETVPLETGPILNSFTKTLLRDLGDEDKKSIRKLYEDRLCGDYVTLARDEDHWKNLLCVTSSDLFINRDEVGRIVSYFFRGKGQDLANIIHEAAFEKALKREMMALLSSGSLWLPERESENIAGPHQIKSMTLLRPGDPALFSRLIHQWSDGHIKVTSMDLEEEKVTYVFEGKVIESGLEHFILCVFGPHPAKEFSGFGRPIYISGLDSI